MKQFAILSGVVLAVIFGTASISNAQCYGWVSRPGGGRDCIFFRDRSTGLKEGCGGICHVQYAPRERRRVPIYKKPLTNK
jgi:hypothetical protein